MSDTQIESRHEIKTERRVADVRPWSERTGEKLADPFNFLFVGIPICALGWVFPVLLPATVIVYLTIYFWAKGINSYLPFRYPSYAKHGTKDDRTGILFIGAVRSSSRIEKFKQCWLSDDDLRKHWLIMGSTGSGKSETLKGIFYNALCWGSGFFVADGKADNKLPTDCYTMALAFGRVDDVLSLNFLLGGQTPQQVARSRRRRSNGLNPFSGSDADTLIQMGANLLPKAEGDGKSWQEKALAVWRAVVTALCYKRDTQSMALSVATIIDYLALPKIEELYVEGFREAQQRGEWSYGFTGIKAYLESGCPAYNVEKLRQKHDLVENGQAAQPRPMGLGGTKRPKAGREFDQDPMSFEQHGYRVGQLMPVLTLLDKTYGYIFRAPFSEIDMIDVALHNRILFLLIPSLEKSSQEAENLGKLAIACLRVMMARNLGADTEGTADELINSKATAASYPFIVALDELGYYFADGIAVMFAQARSLGMSMIAAAQDLEKLMEGNRQAEAGAMVGNSVNKIFMKIDDPGKTLKLVQDTVGKAVVATYSGFEMVGDGFKREKRLNISEQDRISYKELQGFKKGEAIVNALGHTERLATFYTGSWLAKMKNENFHINRFMQIAPPDETDLAQNAIRVDEAKNEKKLAASTRLMQILKGEVTPASPAPALGVYAEMARIIALLDAQGGDTPPMERGVTIYLALRRWMDAGGTAGAQSSPEVNTGGAQTDVLPQTAEIFMSGPEGLAQVLDEHGLPDPLSLLRKPISSILGAAGAAPRPTSVGEAGTEDISFDEESQSSIDDILLSGRDPKRTAEVPPARWVARAVAGAHDMSIHPRSADGSAVGFSDESLAELAHLERELGSQNPEASASVMQQVAASQVTPKTKGEGHILSESEIEDFFNLTLDASNGAEETKD